MLVPLLLLWSSSSPLDELLDELLDCAVAPWEVAAALVTASLVEDAGRRHEADAHDEQRNEAHVNGQPATTLD